MFLYQLFFNYSKYTIYNDVILLYNSLHKLYAFLKISQFYFVKDLISLKITKFSSHWENLVVSKHVVGIIWKLISNKTDIYLVHIRSSSQHKEGFFGFWYPFQFLLVTDSFSSSIQKAVSAILYER